MFFSSEGWDATLTENHVSLSSFRSSVLIPGDMLDLILYRTRIMHLAVTYLHTLQAGVVAVGEELDLIL